MAASSEKLTNFKTMGKKVLAVGINYKSRANERGLPYPERPIIFMKPTTSYISAGQKIKKPPGCTTLYYEAELGIVVRKQGKNIPEDQSMDYVGGYVVALDMTAWDFYKESMTKGLPITLAKGWDTACPVSEFVPKERVSNPSDLHIWLKLNGETKQDSNTSDMIFKIPYLISYLSKYFTLEEGDVIITGSPSGAGEVKSGDIIHAGLADIVDITFTVDSDEPQ